MTNLFLFKYTGT